MHNHVLVYFSYNFAAVITTLRAFLYRRAVATSGPRVLVKWEGRWVVGRVGAAAGYAYVLHHHVGEHGWISFVGRR